MKFLFKLEWYKNGVMLIPIQQRAKFTRNKVCVAHIARMGNEGWKNLQVTVKGQLCNVLVCSRQLHLCPLSFPVIPIENNNHLRTSLIVLASYTHFFVSKYNLYKIFQQLKTNYRYITKHYVSIITNYSLLKVSLQSFTLKSLNIYGEKIVKKKQNIETL